MHQFSRFVKLLIAHAANSKAFLEGAPCIAAIVALYRLFVNCSAPSSLCARLFVLALLFIPSLHAASIDYNRDIRKILSDNCFKCHGPDEEERKGGKKGARLRLDTHEGAIMDLGDRQAVVPGHPEKSELVKRIKTTDQDDLMPPADS